MSFSTQEKIHTANKCVRKAVMYWPIVPVQHRDQFMERQREEVVSGTDTIWEGSEAGHNFHIPWLFLTAVMQFGRAENEGRAVDPSLITRDDETVEESVWFEPRRQTPERKEALDNRWWLQMVPPCPRTFATMPIQPAHSRSSPMPTTGKQKCDVAHMPKVLSKKVKRAALSRRSPSLPPVPGPSRPSCPPHTHPGPGTSGGQCPDLVAPPTGKRKEKVVVEITRGVEDLQGKSMEEGCKWCRLDKSAYTISRTVPAPAHHTPPPAVCLSPPPPPQQAPAPRRPPQVSHREPREIDANAIHPGPDPLPICPQEAIDAPPDITFPRPNTPFLSPPFCPTLISPPHSLNPSRQEKTPLDITKTPCPSPGPPPYWPFEAQQGDEPQPPRPHTPPGGEVPFAFTPQSDGRDLIDFSFTSPVPSHLQWSSPVQQWSPPPSSSLDERVARMEQRQGIIRDLYERISQLEDEVARLKVKEREYN
ncbi:hypothetical protein SERLA73DRAFT_68509 [Serpula lacrymans var. lacrymans S7.3]|uniref:Uncharacterized protein n=1 Tax=Serpula lacrymans var. lacrymans (strain S7.3) TaxID=936435 RepID=F8PGD5_SERL3|nr:hypothetical protein SERLA73DRAFT_68509 [Serpula lacrymans var. lacrymans S7.3]